AERLPPDEFLAVFSQALGRLEALGEQSPILWQQLLRMVLSWGLYRRPRREHDQLRAAARGSHHNVQLQQEVETMGQQLEKNWMEDLLEEEESRGAIQPFARSSASNRAFSSVGCVNTCVAMRMRSRPPAVRRWRAAHSRRTPSRSPLTG